MDTRLLGMHGPSWSGLPKNRTWSDRPCERDLRLVTLGILLLEKTQQQNFYSGQCNAKYILWENQANDCSILLDCGVAEKWHQRVRKFSNDVGKHNVLASSGLFFASDHTWCFLFDYFHTITVHIEQKWDVVFTYDNFLACTFVFFLPPQTVGIGCRKHYTNR